MAAGGEPGDLCFLRRELLARSGLRLRTFSPVASSSRRARSTYASMPATARPGGSVIIASAASARSWGSGRGTGGSRVLDLVRVPYRVAAGPGHAAGRGWRRVQGSPAVVRWCEAANILQGCQKGDQDQKPSQVGGTEWAHEQAPESWAIPRRIPRPRPWPAGRSGTTGQRAAANPCLAIAATSGLAWPVSRRWGFLRICDLKAASWFKADYLHQPLAGSILEFLHDHGAWPQ
jgi:hypothetical protein